MREAVTSCHSLLLITHCATTCQWHSTGVCKGEAPCFALTGPSNTGPSNTGLVLHAKHPMLNIFPASPYPPWSWLYDCRCRVMGRQCRWGTLQAVHEDPHHINQLLLGQNQLPTERHVARAQQSEQAAFALVISILSAPIAPTASRQQL